MLGTELCWMAPRGRVASGVRGVAGVLALLSVFFLHTTARAGMIRMQVTCSVVGTNLLVKMENVGDEAAQNVRARVTFMEKEMHTTNITSFPPMKPKTQRFSLDTRGLKGTYPAVVVVDFEDLNSYPFSSVSIQQIRSAETSPAELMGILQGPQELADRADVPMRIRNKADRQITATCRVVTPNELLADTPEFDVTVPPKGEAKAVVALENFSGTPTSTYPVHVLLEYDHEGEHFCVSASTTVTIVPPTPVASRKFWVFLVIVVVAAGLILLPQIKKAVVRGN